MGSGCSSVVERSPQTPEIRSSNPVIGKLLSNICFQSTVLKRRKKRKKDARNDPFKKLTNQYEMSIFSGDTKKRFSIKAKLGLDVVKLGVIKLGVFTIQQYRRSLVSFTQN